LFIFGYGISFDIEGVKIDLILEDPGREAFDLAEQYVSSKYFNVNVVHSMKEAEGNMESGITQGIITIPHDFSKSVEKGEKPRIQVISDGTDPNTASYVENYAMGIFHKYIGKKPSINVVDRLWFNPSTNTINFMMSGVLTMIISIVGAFMTSMVVAKEWERGTMESLIATPVTIEEIIISKLIPYFVLCVFAVLLAIGYGLFVFNMPFEGSFLATSMVTSVFIIVSLLIGLVISTAAKNQFVAAMGVSVVTFLPSMMLSGFVFEIKSMPLWLQVITHIFPAKYYVSSIRTLCLVGDEWSLILKDTASLGCFAFILLMLVGKVFKKDVE
jgi:ABC-2 type transport system permease protein